MGQNHHIFGTYESNRKLHLWNPICTKSKLIINSDTTCLIIDCDWNRIDTFVVKSRIDSQTIILIDKKNEIKLFYKNAFLFRSKTRRFFNMKDYIKAAN